MKYQAQYYGKNRGVLIIMDEIVTRVRSMITFILAIVYISNLLIKSVWIHQLIIVFLVLVILLSLMAITGSSKVIGYILFAVSILLFLRFKAPLSIWQEGIESNLYMVVMFILVPLLRIPIQHGGYFTALQEVFRRFVYTKRRFYLLVSFITAFVGVLVNMAVVPLVYELCRASDLSNNKKLLCSAISRGYATCIIWSPTMASIALIIQMTGAKWHLFFYFGILSGVIIGLVGFIMMIFEEKESGEELSRAVNKPVGTINYLKVLELSVFGIILISSIAIISYFTGIHTITLVSIAAVVYPIIWLAIIRRLPVFFLEFKKEYFKKSLPALKNEVTLFVGAGLFVTSITYSHLGEYVSRIISLIVGNNVLLFSIFVVFICITLSAIGVHPIVTITVISGTIKATQFGVSTIYMTMLFAIGWTMGISLSPSAANIIAISSLTGQSPIKVGPYYNGRFVLVSSIILIMVITFLHHIQAI
jgi:DcuC family C4-dicarboxylate transporter